MLGYTNRNRISERRKAIRAEILEASWGVARELGIPRLTLAEVAARVGMRAPSLYTHFGSKNDIYDAMFEQAWAQCVTVMRSRLKDLPTQPRARLHVVARSFFEYSVEDLARFQLMNQRVIPDFVPSAGAYAPSLECMEMLTEVMAGMGLVDQADIDLYVSLVGGLIDSQFANDPGGDRYARLLTRAIEMFADDVGLPREEEER